MSIYQQPEKNNNGVVISSIELCAGVGMLGEGVRAAFKFIGWQHRTVAYVEREAPAAAQLIALMESECLDAAPVYSDLLTFRGRDWRGKVDCVIAGFPCQDMSVAGKRAGLNGSRSGLFFNVCDIADDCDAWLLILENVSGITSATAAVVDETEGELEERAVSRVLGELADRGWNAEWLNLSASDVGASHGRERWFCFAWRDVGHAGHLPGSSEQGEQQNKSNRGAWESSQGIAMAYPAMQRALGESGAVRGTDGRPDSGLLSESGNAIGEMADASEPRRPTLPFFAPGPTDTSLARIIADHPHLAPAIESDVRVLVNGLALLPNESRNHQLRQIGNGVVPLQSAAAIVQLVRRSGLSA